jgi:methionyl-tRNA synthetase
MKKFLDINSDEYERACIRLALSYIDLTQCMKCGYPVISGYCCDHCGDDNPSEAPKKKKSTKRDSRKAIKGFDRKEK